MAAPQRIGRRRPSRSKRRGREWSIDAAQQPLRRNTGPSLSRLDNLAVYSVAPFLTVFSPIFSRAANLCDHLLHVSYAVSSSSAALSGWNLPPLIIRAFGAHGQNFPSQSPCRGGPPIRETFEHC